MDGAKHSSTSATPFADSWASISAAAEGGIDQSAIEAANKALEEAMKKIDAENDAAEDDDDVDEDGPADELESLCEAAMRLGMMDETTYDELTDAIASGALSERAAIDEWSRRLDVDTPSNYPDDEDAANVEVLAEDEISVPQTSRAAPATLAIILDTHHLQVAVKAFSVRSGWSVAAFEAALLSACGGGPNTQVVGRFACDASGRGATAMGGLHTSLREAGYELVLSPPKASGMQGATDIDVACCLFKCAGAFTEKPLAECIALVAGDADFRPAIEAVLNGRSSSSSSSSTGGSGVHVLVAAEDSACSKDYKAWMSRTDGVDMINLTPLLGRTASAGGQTVIDLRGPLRPVNSSNGRADVVAIVKACELAVSRGATSLTLNLSSKGGAAWEDAETLDLCKRLARSEAATMLEQLWMHHLPIGDGSCDAIATHLLHVTPCLEQLHISDSKITTKGVATIADAARDAGYGQATPHGGRGVTKGLLSNRRKKLYINARHLGGGSAATVAASASDCCIIRLFDPGNVGDRLAGANLIGASAAKGGKGSKGGAGGKGGFSGGKGGGGGRGGGKGGGGKGGELPFELPPSMHVQAFHPALAGKGAAVIDDFLNGGGKGGRGKGSKGGGKGKGDGGGVVNFTSRGRGGGAGGRGGGKGARGRG